MGFHSSLLALLHFQDCRGHLQSRHETSPNQSNQSYPSSVSSHPQHCAASRALLRGTESCKRGAGSQNTAANSSAIHRAECKIQKKPLQPFVL